MLIPHPETLRQLIARYELLAAQHADAATEHSPRALEDAAYTLCVITGTRNVESALTAARQQVSSAD